MVKGRAVRPFVSSAQAEGETATFFDVDRFENIGNRSRSDYCNRPDGHSRRPSSAAYHAPAPWRFSDRRHSDADFAGFDGACGWRAGVRPPAAACRPRPRPADSGRFGKGPDAALAVKPVVPSVSAARRSRWNQTSNVFCETHAGNLRKRVTFGIGANEMRVAKINQPGVLARPSTVNGAGHASGRDARPSINAVRSSGSD